MLFSMVAIGSMGDVRPYILLGRELQRRGHQTRLLAFAPFEEAARQEGMDFLPLPGSLHHYMESLMRPGNSVVTFLPQLQKAIAGCKDALMDSILAGSQGADAILSTFSLSAVNSVAEKLHIPYIQTYYFPLDPNADFPLPLFPQLPGKRYAGASYRISWLAMNAFERYMLSGWRKAQGMDAPPIKSEPVLTVNGHRVPVLYAISPSLLERPDEWDENIYMTGFWQDDCQQAQPDPQLQAFLDAGEPPVYIGFGSMVSSDMEKIFDKVAEALHETGLRAVVDGGWSSDSLPQKALPYVYYHTGYINHGWLFPRMRAVVHHGGAGTTASGLRAGRPTLVVPFCGEQAFWGHQVYQQQLGPKPLQRSLLTTGRLADALRDLCCNTRYAQNAAAMGERLRSEDGVGNAADLIEKLIAEW